MSIDSKMLFGLKDKVIVVTGGIGILGQRYCEALAERGAHVVISDLDEKACETLAADLNTRFKSRSLGLGVDLTNEPSVKNWASRIFELFKKVDVLVNNAAGKSKNFFAPLGDFALEDWNQVVNVNMTGMFLTIRELGPQMAAAGKGSIINVSSIYGVVGPDQRIYEGSWYGDLGGAINTPLVYSATKGAVISMTRYVATYWGAKGVRCNTLTPGGVSSGQNETFREKYCARVPMNRMAEVEDMVGALLFLASDASSYVNGQNLVVDGGLTAW